MTLKLYTFTFSQKILENNNFPYFRNSLWGMLKTGDVPPKIGKVQDAVY